MNNDGTARIDSTHQATATLCVRWSRHQRRVRRDAPVRQAFVSETSLDEPGLIGRARSRRRPPPWQIHIIGSPASIAEFAAAPHLDRRVTPPAYPEDRKQETGTTGACVSLLRVCEAVRAPHDAQRAAEDDV